MSGTDNSLYIKRWYWFCKGKKRSSAGNEKYKVQLDHNRTKYKIIAEHSQPDGSIIIKIKKQYNNHNVGEYFE